MEYLLLATVGFIAALTPGPDIFYIIKTALTRGKNASFLAVLGVLSGNIIYLTLVALGLAAVGKTPLFQFIVGLFGAIYLIRVAVVIFNEKPELSKALLDSSSRLSIYRDGLLVNLSNPKAIIFFGVVITPFISKSITLSLGSLFFGIAVAFFMAGYFASSIEITPRVLKGVNRVSALIFLFFSFKLLITAYDAYTKLINL
jgi:threonine/homoserine/homoserine lactone efflux protein